MWVHRPYISDLSISLVRQGLFSDNAETGHALLSPRFPSAGCEGTRLSTQAQSDLQGVKCTPKRGFCQ